jgi:hypothetical protein
MCRNLMKTVLFNQTVIAFPFALMLYPLVKWRGIQNVRLQIFIYVFTV